MNKERPQARSFFVPGKGRYDPGQPEDGDTVKMLKDYTSDKNDLFTMIFVKKQLTLDLNGFDIDSLTVGRHGI